MVKTENYKIDKHGNGKLVAHSLKDDTTNRSRQRHLKEVQQMQDAAIRYRILKGE